MSRMNAPWTNPESFSDAMPEFLRSPMTIAVGASLLAHGIFFLGLPVVANHANKDDLRPVNVVQLTPQEQAQVPAIAIPSATLPPNSTLTNPFPSVLTPNSPLSPTTPGLSDGSLNSPKFDIDTSNSGTSGTTYNYPWLDLFPNRSTSPTPETKPSPSPSPSPSPNSSPSPSPSASATPSPLQSVTPQPNPSPQATPAPSSSPTSNPTTAATPAPQPTTLAAANTPEERARQQALYQFDDGTQPTSSLNSTNVSKRSTDWHQLPKVREILGPKPFAEQLRPAQFPYPKQLVALRGAKHSVFGLVIGKDGKVLDQPILIKGGGYGKLDFELMKEVKNKTFQPDTSEKAVLFSVKFEEPAPPIQSPNPPS
jgi:hypothetical protein